jgi:hypothetical protein
MWGARKRAKLSREVSFSTTALAEVFEEPWFTEKPYFR